jgi:hypothetical protein
VSCRGGVDDTIELRMNSFASSHQSPKMVALCTQSSGLPGRKPAVVGAAGVWFRGRAAAEARRPRYARLPICSNMSPYLRRTRSLQTIIIPI